MTALTMAMELTMGGGEGGATALAMTEGKGSSDVGDHDFGAELGCW